MEFFLSLIVAAALAWLLRKPIRKAPWLFYALAVAADVVLVCGVTIGMPPAVWKTVILMVQRCQFAMALLAVVMFIGVFSQDSAVKKGLLPIRAELSIVAALLTAGHAGYYLAVYFQQLLHIIALPVIQISSLVVALVLTVLLIVLTATSFKKLKAMMSAKAWKSVQQWSYLFFGLIYVHVLFIFLPSLTTGVSGVAVRFAAYTAMFATYALLRVRRHLIDAREVG